MHLVHHYLAKIAYHPQSPFRATNNPLSEPSKFLETYHFIISSENSFFAVLAIAATHCLFHLDMSESSGGGSGRGSRVGSPTSRHDIPEDLATPAVLARAREDYLYLALSEQREAVTSLNAQNINAVCFASMLIMNNELANLAWRNLDVYEPPMKWLQMGRGVGTVFDTAESKLGVLDPGWGMNIMATMDPHLEDPDIAAAAFARMGDVGRRFITPTNFPGEDIQNDPHTSEVYHHAVKYIGTIWQAIDAGQEGRSIATKVMAFPACVANEFVDYVSECRPRALAVLAHIFHLAQEAHSVWFFRNMPSREIAAIWRVLPSEWRPLLPEVGTSP